MKTKKPTGAFSFLFSIHCFLDLINRILNRYDFSALIIVDFNIELFLNSMIIWKMSRNPLPDHLQMWFPV